MAVEFSVEALKNMVGRLRTESQSGLAARLATEVMAGPLRDAHRADAGPIEFDHFDTLPTIGNTQITAVVGAGNDVTLWASTSNTNEAGVIVLDSACSQGFSLAAGAGGSNGWGIVSLDWGTTAPGPAFQSLYAACPGSGYGTTRVFAHDFTAHRHKPLHGRTIDSGGQITARLVVRPLGVAGSTVFWPGGDLTAISSAACNMIQKMQIWMPGSYGPIHVRGLFSENGKAGNPGRKSVIANLFGGGKIARLLGGLSGIVDPRPEQAR